MLQVAIVEDNPRDMERLQKALRKFESQSGEQFHISVFTDAESFLNSYSTKYDLLFLDVELPNQSGLQAAKRIREMDRQAVLIFVTNAAQYAVLGYEVDALAYVVKPIVYADFTFKLEKALRIIKSNIQVEIKVPVRGGWIFLSSKDICYIEVDGHTLTFHTKEENYEVTGSITQMEEKLAPQNFLRCNSCYLINPRYILYVKGLEVTMRNGDVLKISRPKKKKFLDDLTNWLGEGNTNGL